MCRTLLSTQPLAKSALTAISRRWALPSLSLLTMFALSAPPLKCTPLTLPLCSNVTSIVTQSGQDRCLPPRQCNANEFMVHDYTPSTDRQCQKLRTCPAGTFISTQNTATADRQCSPCQLNRTYSSLVRLFRWWSKMPFLTKCEIFAFLCLPSYAAQSEQLYASYFLLSECRKTR